mmetsp:Transcript_124373/g.265027  ORF Transcript_124373/g.265027 Transcript_124373/m.265027 type:complete len:134 (+) Transcript_124373:99-500(+)
MSPAPQRSPGLSAARAEGLLCDLLAGFSTRGFQRKLDNLLSVQPKASGQGWWWQLDGRKELVLRVQREVLPNYGFPDDEMGFALAVEAMQPFLGSSTIAKLSEAIQQKLRLPAVGEGVMRDEEPEAEPPVIVH